MISCYRTLHSPIRTFPHSPQLKLLFRTALRSEKLNCTLHSTEFLAPLASSPHRKNVNYGQQVACADLKMHKCYAIKNWQSAKCHWPKTSFKISFFKISTLKNRNKKTLLNPLKVIVSRDWEGLQMIWLQRLEVFNISAECFFLSVFSYRIFKNGRLSGASFQHSSSKDHV